jgi:hypothetical protein
VRLQLHTLPTILQTFLRTLALPEAVKYGSLTSMREKLIKIGAKIVRYGRYVIFQMAEVAVPRELFQEILRLIEGLRPRPAPA